jgi:hypothetical protein
MKNTSQVDAFRLIDSMYRVHTRLYKLHYTLYSTTISLLKSNKLNSLSRTAVIIGALLVFVNLFVEIFKIDLFSAPLLIIYGIIIAIILIEISLYIEADKTEKEFEKLLKIHDVGDSLESWKSFTLDEIGKLSTRIVMINAILKDEPDSEIITRYKKILEFNINEIKEIKEINEKLFAYKKRSKSDYNEIKMRLKHALEHVGLKYE